MHYVILTPVGDNGLDGGLIAGIVIIIVGVLIIIFIGIAVVYYKMKIFKGMHLQCSY